jgi:hypothetical protein
LSFPSVRHYGKMESVIWDVVRMKIEQARKLVEEANKNSEFRLKVWNNAIKKGREGTATEVLLYAIYRELRRLNYLTLNKKVS